MQRRRENGESFFLLVSEKKRQGHEYDPYKDDQDRVGDKIGKGHQPDAGYHRDQFSFILPVDEIAHADRAEQETPEQRRCIHVDVDSNLRDPFRI